MGSVKAAWIAAHELSVEDEEREQRYLASLTPPPTRDERAGEAAWHLRMEREARWRKAQLEDSQSWREDEEFWRYGC